MDNKQQ